MTADDSPREWTLAEAMEWFERQALGWPDGKHALAAIKRALSPFWDKDSHPRTVEIDVPDTGPHWHPGGPTRDHWGDNGP